MNAEQNRQIENLIRVGAISQINYKEYQFRVKSGEIETDWLPWPAEIGRNFVRWRPLREGTQVVLACPSGDLAQAVVVSVLYQDAVPPTTTDKDIDIIQFESGSLIKHDAATGDLTLVSANTVNIEAENEINLKAAHVNIESDNHITSRASLHRIYGPIKSTGGDHCCDGVSHKFHFHYDAEDRATEKPVPTC
jgi:phage baseplate assembly protein V